MGRIPFHVSPHFDLASPAASNELEELQKLADLSGMPVLLLQDGAGVVVQDEEIIFSVGSPRWITVAADETLAADGQERCVDRGVSGGQSLAG